jgi:hypothetical protein
VGICERIGDVAELANDVARIETTLAANALRERFAIDVAHDEEGMSAEFVGAMDGDDVLMRQSTGRARLAQEPLADHEIAREMRGERLDRYATIESEIASEVDDSHATATDLTLQVVLPVERGGEANQVCGVFRR